MEQKEHSAWPILVIPELFWRVCLTLLQIVSLDYISLINSLFLDSFSHGRGKIRVNMSEKCQICNCV